MIRNPETLGQRVLLLRTMHSLKPSQVAKSLKMSQRQYALLEEGKSMPDYFTVERLMNIYGCTSDYLLFGIMLGLRKELFDRLTYCAMGDLDAAQVTQYYDKSSLNGKTP